MIARGLQMHGRAGVLTSCETEGLSAFDICVSMHAVWNSILNIGSFIIYLVHEHS